MKKPFKNTAVGKILHSKVGKAVGSFVKGALGVYIKPLAGAVAGVVQVREDNLTSEEGGKGRINWSHFIGLVASLTLLALHLTGKLTLERFEYAMDFLSNIL